ncbi:MAG: DUF378 domain-containing protein [Verrucomicrobiota bacterium]
MDKQKALGIVNVVAPILVTIGAINWGLVGLFEWNFIEEIFADGGSAYSTSTLAKIIYILIGLSALWNIGLIPKLMKK